MWPGACCFSLSHPLPPSAPSLSSSVSRAPLRAAGTTVTMVKKKTTEAKVVEEVRLGPQVRFFTKGEPTGLRLFVLRKERERVCV